MIGTAKAADGSSIAFEVHGRGRTTVVLVHGWACDRHYWDGQLPALSAAHQVVTIDLAGHGDSSGERRDWSISRFARDVTAVLEAIDARDAVLVGHSLGGPVVVEAALCSPDRVSAVIGVECFFDLWMAPEFKALLPALEANFVEQTTTWVRDIMFPPGADPNLVARVAGQVSTTPPKVGVPALAGLVAWCDGRLVNALRTLRIPFRLVMAGDPPQATSIATAAASHLAGFGVDMVADVGHFLMLEAPARFDVVLVSAITPLGEAAQA